MSENVLDASAVLALLYREPGSALVATLLDVSVISAVNLAEVASRFAEDGMPWDVVLETIGNLNLEVVPFGSNQAYETGRLRPLTKTFGLSMGDRACLALAQQMQLPALTTDRSWSNIPEFSGLVQLIR